MRILVCGLGGGEVEFDLAPEITLWKLKQHIGDLRKIAPGCQSLSCGDVVLRDDVCVGELFEDGSDALSLTLSLSDENLEKAYEKLQDQTQDQISRHKIKIEALETIRLWFSNGTGDERAIKAVAAQLEESSQPVKLPGTGPWKILGPSEVQLMAVKTLQSIAVKGDDLVIAEVIKRIDSCQSHEVYYSTSRDDLVSRMSRDSAFLALPKIAEKGDERALASLYRFLDDCDETTRKTTVAVLVEVAGRGNTGAIAEVSSRFSHGEPGVRETAAQCLAQIADKGDQLSINALNVLKDDPVGCVKRAAAEALERLTP